MTHTSMYVFKCMIYAALTSLSGFRVVYTAEDTSHLGYRTLMIRAGPDLQASFLPSRFHSSRKYYESCQRSESTKQSYQAATPMNHSNSPAWQVVHKGEINGTHFLVATNSYLIGLKDNSCLVL